MLDAMIGSGSKILIDELNREVVAHDIDNWRNEEMWTMRV